MPLGGRTPDSPQPHTPGPAPTDSGVCAISPSDLVGYTGNLINRVNELEQRIAELEAGNIEVNQLSDLSQQIGWVDGITYMGVEGWTQTSYGTLIPPAGWTFLGSGFTLSDGNQYQGVYYDQDGVLQFGFLAGGAGVTGALPTVWNTAGETAQDYAITSFRDSGGSYSSSRGITITDAAPTSGEGDAKLTVSRAGIYLVNGSVAWFRGSPVAYSGTLALFTPYGAQDDGDSNFIDTDSNATLTWQVSKLLNLSAGDLIELDFDVTPFGVPGTLLHFVFSAIRLTSN